MVSNNVAWIVLTSKKSEHVTPLLERLYLLPVKSRLHYKISAMTFKCLHGMVPAYLATMSPYEGH